MTRAARRMAAVGAALVPALLGAATAVAAAGTLRGRVTERGTGAPVPGAHVSSAAYRLGAVTDEAGGFALAGLPEGVLLLSVRRAGYVALEVRVHVPAADTTLEALALAAAPVRLSQVEVRSDRSRHAAFDGQRPVEVTGARLRERLGRTVAETLAEEPGLAQRSLGPSPARPVLRGLGAERLPILEDGTGTGDLSATADDHAVTIEPLAARSLEVLRGPATLELGSGALAGVVNVRRNYVPDRLPDGVHGSVSLQGESTSRGAATAAALSLPLGRWAVSAQGVGRRTEALRTPAGTLGNTEMGSHDAAVGVARVWRTVRAGASVAEYRSRYGIPGGYAGGHTRGVDVDLERRRAEWRLDLEPGAEGAPRTELGGVYTRYYHRELESRDVPAVSFGVLTWEGFARVRRDGPGGRDGGAAGLAAEYRDYRSGFVSLTPPTLERALAAFAHQSWSRGDWHLHAGLRADARRVSPTGRDTNKAGVIGERRFAGLSAGVLGEWRAGEAMTLAASLMRTTRAPSVEHLFTEGPHLAAYAYEIGNAALGAEEGTGLNLAARWAGRTLRGSVAIFHNEFERFHYAADTGELEVGPGAEGLLRRYRFAGAPVRMQGGEIEAAWAIGGPWSLEGGASAVRGRHRDTGRPLPAMPPVHARVALRYQDGAWAAHLSGEGSAAQHRTAEFEEPTAAWATASCGVTREWGGASRHASVVFGVHNLFDAEYRDHLSRIKSIMPQAGRDVRVSLRLAF